MVWYARHKVLTFVILLIFQMVLNTRVLTGKQFCIAVIHKKTNLWWTDSAKLIQLICTTLPFHLFWGELDMLEVECFYFFFGLYLLYRALAWLRTFGIVKVTHVLNASWEYLFNSFDLKQMACTSLRINECILELSHWQLTTVRILISSHPDYLMVVAIVVGHYIPVAWIHPDRDGQWDTKMLGF